MRRVVWITLGLLAIAGHASGEGSEADRLFDEGRALAKDGKFAEACEKFTRSFEIDHAVGTELNLGDCHEQLGHLREAWRLFDAAAKEFDRTGNAARAKFARGRADAVAAKLVEIVVRVAQPAQPGLEITIAGRPEVPAAEIRERVEPGAIEVTASAPGGRPFATTAHVAAGASVSIEIPALGGTEAPPPIVRHDDPRRARVRLAWVLGGAGGATAVTALGFALVGNSHYSTAADGPDCTHVSGGVTCNDVGTRAIHDAQRLADIGTGFALVSAALLASSAIVYLTAPSSDSVVVAPTANAQGVGFAVSARF